MAFRKQARPDTITLDDVETLLREVQKAHNCDIKLELTVPVQEGTAVLFWCKVVATPRTVAKRTIRGVVAKSHRWPTGEALTHLGLFFRLLYDLDRALDEVGHVPAEQASFQEW